MYRVAWFAAAFTFGLSGCGFGKRIADDCEYRPECLLAGLSGAGGESGAAGTAGAGGMSGGGGQPCDGACSGATPVCREASNTCVECTTNAHCSGAEPVCNPTTNTCVQCREDDDCATREGTPYCAGETATCVACVENAQCGDATASRCENGACAACETNDDCAHIDGKDVCDAGECVQCTGRDYAACGTDPTTGAARVCDTRMRTCTTNPERSADVCQPCLSDAQCKAGQLCAMQSFGTPAQEVGYFCFWKRGDTANGAPEDCFLNGRPFADVAQSQVSIDGAVADLCDLRVSTCDAYRHFSTLDCATAGTPDDTVCGSPAPNDAVCDRVNVSAAYRCTMRCAAHEDCPENFSCSEGATRYCEL